MKKENLKQRPPLGISPVGGRFVFLEANIDLDLGEDDQTRRKLRGDERGFRS